MGTPEESIELDVRVERVYKFGLPLVFQPSGTLNRLDELVKEFDPDVRVDVIRHTTETLPDAALLALTRRIVSVLQSFREDAPPTSALHALFVRDWQDVGSMAAITDCDLATAEAELDLLVDSGLVDTRESDGFREYSIAWRLGTG